MFILFCLLSPIKVRIFRYKNEPKGIAYQSFYLIYHRLLFISADEPLFLLKCYAFLCLQPKATLAFIRHNLTMQPIHKSMIFD